MGLYFWAVLTLLGFSVVCTEFTVPDSLSEEGKRQYEMISEKSKLPTFGSCWKNAVSQLNVGCKYLNENVQGKLALSLTDCFLQSSGHESLNCRNKDCLLNLSDRAFNAYTEFYTHTTSMCYFLRSQVWHEETEKTIDKLKSTSDHVSAQLEAAEKAQDLLLNRQRESMLIQGKLLTNGVNLASTLQVSKNQITFLMDEFRSATREQKDILFDIFDHLTAFKSWAIGEVSWLDTIVFYLASCGFNYLLTSTPRTQSARILSFVLLFITALIERYICFLVINNYISVDNAMNHISESLQFWVWIVRKVYIVIITVVLLTTSYLYKDYHILNNNLLNEIKQQNNEIIKLLRNVFKKDDNETKIEVEDCHDGAPPPYRDSFSSERRSVTPLPSPILKPPVKSIQRIQGSPAPSSRTSVESTASRYNLRRTNVFRQNAV